MHTPRSITGLVALTLLALSACSASAPAPAVVTSSTSGVPSSAAAPAAAGSESSVDDFLGRMGSAQAGARTYTLDMTMETSLAGKPTQMKMTGRYDRTDPANVKLEMSTDLGGMATKILQVDGEMYMQLDPTSNKWIKMPADAKAQYDSQASSTDVTAKLQEVKGSIKKIENLGEENIGGTQTTHYRLTIDAASLGKLTGSEGELSADSFVYDVWLDAANLTRKVAMDLQAKNEGVAMPIKVSGLFSHYNEPVQIKAPKPEQIVKMPG